MEVLVYVPVLLFSFVAHEFAHAWVAYRQGDPTAYQLGRVTLNPIPHIDLFGTIIVPAMLIATNSSFLIGWAKPVPIVSRNFRNYRRGDLLVSVAGVTANFIIAVASTLLMIVLVHAVRAAPSFSPWAGPVQDMLEIAISLNFILVVFNLLPVPPLDGSRLIYHILPERIALWYRGVERWGLLVFILLLVSGAITVLLWPAAALMELSRALIEWST